MAAAAILSVTLVPALMVIFVRGKIVPEAQEPDQPLPDLGSTGRHRRGLRWQKMTILVAVLVTGDVWPARQLGSEFMPTLNEGTLMYMPTTLPGMSVTKAAELLQTQDRIIKSFPEVASVYGKAGRANTATDPAPTEMFETIINLKPKENGVPACHDRQPDRRDGQGAAVPRRLERLDHADPRAHRHAVDRHPHAGRRQGLRHRS
jgi:Cu(I)/Ag(I) efflux system membrane protein CusA/SilA